jgi:hypothetical protein
MYPLGRGYGGKAPEKKEAGQMSNPEVLAPAGSMDALTAAVR